MSRIIELFKFQYDNKFTLFKKKGVKNIFVQIAKYLIIIAAISLGLYLLLKKMFFLLNLQINAEFLAFVVAGTQIISFVFAISSIIKNLYLSQDNELLIALPVTFNQIFISKIIILYLSDLLFNILYILPIFLTLGFLGTLPATYYVMLLFYIPISPILPIALGSIISIPVMFIIKFLKKNNIVYIITMLVLVASIFVLYMSFITKISGFINFTEKQLEISIKVNKSIREIGSHIFGFYQIALCLISYKYFYYLLAFFAMALVIFVFCFMAIRPIYYKFTTINFENNNRDKIYYKKFKKRKPFAELFVNEFRETFRSPGDIFQFFIFSIFMPLIVFTYDKLLNSIAVNQVGQIMIIGTHFLILSICALMNNAMSASAVSRNGKNFYLSKIIPVNYYTQVGAKIAFNSLFTIGAVIITTICSIFLSGLSVYYVLIIGLITIFLSFGHICQSYDMDLSNPVLDWYDSSEISAVSKTTRKSMLIALVLPAVLFLNFVLLQNIGIIVAVVLSFLYCLASAYMLYIKIEHCYNAVEM